ALHKGWRKRAHTSERNKVLTEGLKPALRIDRARTQYRISRDRLEHGDRGKHQSIPCSNQAKRSSGMPRRLDDTQALVLKQNLVGVLQSSDVIKRISEPLELLIACFHSIDDLRRHARGNQQLAVRLIIGLRGNRWCVPFVYVSSSARLVDHNA